MPQDAFTLRLTAKELNAALTGGRINRINQPEREELSFIIYTGKRTVKLTLNANAADCGAYFTEDDRENPLVAPNFCMLLRKHLQGAQILGVEQVGFERILALRFLCVSDFSTAERVLYAEIMGKYSNLILTQNKIILGALKTTSADAGAKRLILPGAAYVLPAAQDKADPSDLAALGAVCAHAEGDLEHFLFTRVAGLAPCTARMLAQNYTGGDLARYVHDAVFSDEVSPCVLERDGKAVDFYARSVQGAIPFATLSAAQCYYYGKKRGENIIFKFRMDGLDVCHLGDLGEDCSSDLIEMILPVNVLLIPVGGNYTIDSKMAKEYVDRIMPDIVIPMHYRAKGCKLDIDKVDDFLDEFDGENVCIVEEGSCIEVSRDDLDGGQTTIIVMEQVQ